MNYFNKLTDTISRMYVDQGPLEQSNKQKKMVEGIKGIPLVKDLEKSRDDSSIIKVSNYEPIQISSGSKTPTNSGVNTFEHVNSPSTLKPKKNVDEQRKIEFNLLPSEQILQYEEKIHLRVDDHHDFKGHLILTDFRIIFKPNGKNHNHSAFPYFPDDYFDIPIFCISKMEKTIDKKNSSNYQLEILTKDNRVIKLINENSSKHVYAELAGLINPNTKDNYGYINPAVKYRECHPVNNDGWTKYDPIEEFRRMGVEFSEEELEKYGNIMGNYSWSNHWNNLTSNNNNLTGNNNLSGNNNLNNIKNISNNKFRISFINQKFELCQSYPEMFVVPKEISDEDLREAASFRTKSRIPVLCYYNKDNNVSLWRSSQTRSGLTYQRNEKDEKLLQAIYEVGIGIGSSNNSNSNNISNNTKLMIYDARPYLNAFANRFKGAGYENTDFYKNSEICFCEIDNIHKVRDALSKLNGIINGRLIDNKNFFSQLEASTWLNFIYQIIKSAVDIANSIRNGRSVLIHCSDGWDRSSQLTSLSQLLIDPFYRTLEGFVVLIEKEWLGYGHQFGLRNGFYNLKDHTEDQRAPIFLQWLDCVHQILVQFPHLFEFNMDLLLFLAYHLNTCKYGTFLFNSEFERQDKHVKNKTVSIWTDVLENRNLFVNPFYENVDLYGNNNNHDKTKMKYLLPNFPLYKIRFWEEHFLRFLHFNTGNNFGKIYSYNNNISANKNHLNINNNNINNNNNSSESDSDNPDPSLHTNINTYYMSNSHKIKSNLMTKTKIQTNIQFIELEKVRDKNLIAKQSEEIKKLKAIIQEISTKLKLKVNEYNMLTPETKEVITDLNDVEIVEEDGYVIIKSSMCK